MTVGWEERLNQAGCRITAPRRAVMTVLEESERPLTPQAVMERGETLHPKLGLVTVYRTLELFEQLRLVRRVHQGEGCQAYMVTAPGHRHAVICRRCGRATEFAGAEDLEALIARVEARTGYRVDGHLLQLSGLCFGCRQKEDED
jgi:Fur family ferric uptake transcriptional regulator